MLIILLLAFVALMEFGGRPSPRVIDYESEREIACAYHVPDHDPWIDLGGES